METQNHPGLQGLLHHSPAPTSGVDFEVAKSLLQHSRIARDAIGDGPISMAESKPGNATSPSDDPKTMEVASESEQEGRHTNSQERQTSIQCAPISNPAPLGQACRYVSRGPWWTWECVPSS